MAPIRTALIGLSSTAKTSWASSAHLPYLLSARGRERYQIVALLNSSADAARAAIAVYDLDPATTRAYGKPEDLAADPDVDLVVCCTRVDVHFDSAWASVAAGKAAYIEWPLAQDAAHARELTLLAKEKGARSIIGLQGRLAPPVRKLKEVIASGRIGTVLSVELRAFGGTNAADILPRGLDYFLRKETGGNIYTIVFAHAFDWVKSVLGKTVDTKGHFQLQRPETKIRETDGTFRIVKSDVPDLISITATMEGSPTVQEGATLQARLRRGQPFPGEVPVWLAINGEKGEIRITNSVGTSLHSSADTDTVKIEIYHLESGTVERVQWGWDEWQKELPVAARNVGAVYEEFAKGERGAYPTFEDGLALHEQLEGTIAPFYDKKYPVSRLRLSSSQWK